MVKFNEGKELQGRFIVVEGPDGSGKSTAVQTIKEELEAQGYVIVVTREMGGCSVSEKIRTIVLNNRMSLDVETGLAMLARVEHLEQVVLPALAAGKVVVCDRFIDSTIAYQGCGKGGLDGFKRLQTALGDKHMFPANTTVIVMDVTLKESNIRLAARGEKPDMFELLDDQFKQRVMDYYSSLHGEPGCIPVSGMGTREEVAERVKACLRFRVPHEINSTTSARPLLAKQIT
jgi:dTMP kinase